MHERNGAQLICLAALAAVNCLFTALALALGGSSSPAVTSFGWLAIAGAWVLWLVALRSWIRSVHFARSTAGPRAG